MCFLQTGVCVRPVATRNPWLSMRLSRPQVIQLNVVSVVMVCVAHRCVTARQEGVSRLVNNWKTKEDRMLHTMSSAFKTTTNVQREESRIQYYFNT